MPFRAGTTYAGRMTEDLREIARKRIKARRDFWMMIAIFLALSALFVVIWFVSGIHNYFWPMWPMLGFAIATVASALSTFGPGSAPITDAKIDEEIRKMGGDAGAGR